MAEIGMSFLAPLEATQRMDALARAEPYELAHKASLARLHHAQASTAEAAMAADKRMAAMLANGEPVDEDGEALSPVAQIQRLAGVAARSGAINKATDLMKTASAMEAHQATEAAANARANAARIKTQLDAAKSLAGLMEGVGDENSWQKANQAIAMQTGQPSPYANMEYNPQFVDLLKKSTVTTLQRSELALKEAEDKRKAAEHQLRTEEMKARKRLVEAQITRARERAVAGAKAGGPKDVGVTSPQSVKHASAMLENEPELALSPEGRELAARDLASESRALMKAHPGLSEGEALAQAFESAKQEGRFAVVEEGGVTLPFLGRVGGKTTGRYKRDTKKGLKGAALPLPDTVEGLEKGKTYNTPSGKGIFDRIENGKPIFKRAE